MGARGRSSRPLAPHWATPSLSGASKRSSPLVRPESKRDRHLLLGVSLGTLGFPGRPLHTVAPATCLITLLTRDIEPFPGHSEVSVC